MASFERLAWKLMKVLLIATGEVAAAAEAQFLHDVAHATEALVFALLGVDQ